MSTIAGTVIDPKALPPLPGDNLAALFAQTQWMSLIRSGRAFMRNATAAAAVGNLSAVQLGSPTTIQVLLYDIIFYVGTASDVILSVGQLGAGSGIQGVNLLTLSVGSGGNVNSGNAAAGFGGTEIRRFPSVAANTPVRVGVSPEFLMAYPTSTTTIVGVQAATANVAISASFVWAEVPNTGYF